jgi:hypothetical protein
MKDFSTPLGFRTLVIDKKSPSDAYGIITFADIAKAVIAERGNAECL